MDFWEINNHASPPPIYFYLSLWLSLFLAFYLYFSLPPSLSFSLYLSFLRSLSFSPYLSFLLSLSLFLSLSISLSLSFFLSIYLSLSLSGYLSLSLFFITYLCKSKDDMIYSLCKYFLLRFFRKIYDCSIEILKFLSVRLKNLSLSVFSSEDTLKGLSVFPSCIRKKTF